MNLGLAHKVVLITGATGGIGRYICLDFLREGAQVVCLYRNEIKYQETKKWLESEMKQAVLFDGIKCDLSLKKNIQESIKLLIQKYSRLDVLVNCSGVVEEIPFGMCDEEIIDKMIHQNLKVTMMVTQAALKPMFSQSEGAIVNISSVVASKGGRGIVAYTAAKSGIEGFTRALAHEVGRKNIRINSVKPGAIQTNMSQHLKDRAADYIIQSTVLGRFGNPHEVSKAVLFLSSNETASYITGTSITVDGGFLL